MNVVKNERRKSALERITRQLQLGTKPERVEGNTTINLVPLTKEDIAKKEVEINNLKAVIIQ